MRKETGPALPPAAFSKDGYIISQKNTKAAPYGRFTSDFNGCGWIAAFNLFKAAGRPRSHAQVSRELAGGSPFNCMLGTGPRRLRRYLEANGFRIKTAHSRKKAAALAQKSRMGIVMYDARGEVHYVTYITLPGGRMRFLNAVDGAQKYVTTLEGLLRAQARLPYIYLMAVA